MSANRIVLKLAYLRKAKRAALECALSRGYVTIDDIRERVPFPKELNPKINGDVTADFRRLDLFVEVTHQKSRRKIAHSRPITLWRLANSAEAKQWLIDHPDLPWPEESGVIDPQLRLFPNPKN